LPWSLEEYVVTSEILKKEKKKIPKRKEQKGGSGNLKDNTIESETPT